MSSWLQRVTFLVLVLVLAVPAPTTCLTGDALARVLLPNSQQNKFETLINAVQKEIATKKKVSHPDSRISGQILY